MSFQPTIDEIHIDSPGYPRLLREIAAPPQILYHRGFLPGPSLSLFAIVGTRKATRDGTSLARRIARELAERGFGSVSGLAFGIDAAAHEGTLEGGGKTFAVLANGLDAIYPTYHERLALDILHQGGGLLSEYPMGTPALPHHFLERNRIVAGLALATIVIEAPVRSGALVTARLAAEHGREVFVFPGPAGHLHYTGSHHLIRTGARLVSSLADIFEDLQGEFSFHTADPQPTAGISPHTLSPDEKELCVHIQQSGSGCTIDQLVVLTGKEPSFINQKLTPLIMKGVVIEKPGGIFVTANSI